MSVTVGICNLTIPNPDFLKIGFQMVWFSKGYKYAPYHLKTGQFKIRPCSPGFQMVFENKVAIWLDLKYLGFQMSDTIQNPNH